MARPIILLVDDVNLIIQLEKSFLKHLPVDVLIAGNGQQALEMIRAHRPDLVYMDLNMPVMDGPACCAALKADEELRSIPIIMVTTAGREEDELLCREAGCDDFITKPIDRQIFLEKGRKFLEDFDRRQPRVECDADLSLAVSGASLEAKVSDISVGGLYVATDAPLPREGSLEMAFSLPGDEAKTIEVTGRVAWENSPGQCSKPHYPAGFGVEFTDLDPDAASFIQAFVDGTTINI